MGTNMHINRLPSEILGKVMSFLNWSHRRNGMLVCKRWYELLRQPLFQQEMFIKLSSVNHLEEIPSSLGQREIRNMRFSLAKDSPPNFCELAGLLPHIKSVQLDGVFSAADIDLCVRHFPYLEAIEIEILDDHQVTLGQDQEFRSRLSASMSKLREATVVIPRWYVREDLILLLNSLSGVSNVSLRWKMPMDNDIIISPHLPKRGHDLVNNLSKLDLVKRLQRLDLPCFNTPPESFSLLVEMPDLNLRSLKFVSYDGAQHLDILAKSSQNLQTLNVTFRGPRSSYAVEYSEISALLVAKPSLKSVTMSGVKYDPGQSLGYIFKAWPNANTLHMAPHDMYDRMLFEFSRKAGKNTLLIRSFVVAFDEEALLILAEHSPRLEELKIHTPFACRATVSLPLLLNSLPGITKLSVSFTELAGIDLRMPAVPNEDTNRLLNLQSLYLGYWKFLTDADIATLRFPKLRHLWLSNSPTITDSGVCSVVTNNPGLRLLGLGRCPNVTDRSVEAIGTHLRYLQCLLLFHCGEVTPDAARMLENGCHMLEFIDVRGCRLDVIGAMMRMRGSMSYLSDVLYSSGRPVLTVLTTSEWGFAIHDDWIVHDSSLSRTHHPRFM